MMGRLLLVLAFCAAACPGALSQDWEGVKADRSLIWGEGWGASVEEADRQALSDLVTKVTVAVVSDYRQVEEQVRSSAGNEHYLMQSNRTAAYSSATLQNTHRIVLETGRRAHVGRWMRRDDLAVLFTDRKDRVLEYEASAARAERCSRLDEALRYHYWAYVLLRSLPRPSELRSSEGRMLLNAIPERMTEILDDLKIRPVTRSGGTVVLSFSFRDQPVSGLDFRYFDGARWSPLTSVRHGRASIDMAPGALADYIQLRVEYAYSDDSLLDGELHDTMEALNLKPIRKSFIVFKYRV